MSEKIVLANPIDIKEIWFGLMIGIVSGSILLIWETLESGFSSIAFFVSLVIVLPLCFFGWNYRHLVVRPKNIEIQGDCLIIHFRFKSKPLVMRLEDIATLTVSLDGSSKSDWYGYDAVVTLKEKKEIEWFPLYWKSGIVVRERYKSRFGEYPPMRQVNIRK